MTNLQHKCDQKRIHLAKKNWHVIKFSF